MKIIKTLQAIGAGEKSAVIAIGNFDGVHRGHQALLQKAKDKSQELGKPFGVLTFEPHPKMLFRPDDPPARITPPDVKAWRIREFGVEALFSLPFDWEFASQTAEEFIQNILKDGIAASHVVVGYDFCFGQMRKGAPEDIESSGIPTSIIKKIEDESGEALSSSRVRQALRHGKIQEANEILGWDWEIWGDVVKGDQRGRELGYPTANIALGDAVHPAYGIYAARVQIEGEDEWRGAAVNVGIRPMFEVPIAQVEAFIFDFDQEIYGKTLRVKLVQRLRSEAKFDSLGALIAQMDEDCEKARDILV